MATISSQEFFSKGTVSVVGNETTQKEAFEPLPQSENPFKRVSDVYTKNLKDQFTSGLERGAEALTTQPEALNKAKQEGDVAGQVVAPVRGGLRLAGGVAQSLFSPITAAIETAVQGYSELDQATGGRVADKIKSIAENNPEVVEGISAWISQNPEKVKDAEDLLNIVGAKVAPKGGSILKETIKREGGELLDVTKKVVSPILEKVEETGGKIKDTITPEASSIMQRVARVSKGKQANFEQRAGESIGEYLDKRGIYGDVEDVTQQLYERFSKSKQTADDALAEIQGTYRSAQLRTALTELEEKVTRTSSPGAPDPDLVRIKELSSKEKRQGLTMPEINEAKRLYERRVKLDFLKENAPEQVTRANNIDNALRQWQFTEAEKAGLKNLPEINRETMLSKQLLDDLGNEYAGSAGNNSVTLTDWIALSGGDVNSIAMFLTKQGLSSKKVQSVLAKYFSKNKEKIGVPKAEFKEKLELPSPKEGQSDISIETPINLRKESQSTIDKRELNKFGNTYDADKISSKLKNSLLNDPTGKHDKPNRFVGEEYSYKEAKTGLAENGEYIKERIIIGKDGKGNLVLKDGTHLLEAYRDLGIKIPKDKIKFEDGVTFDALK